jgi:hypothetical protein
MSGPRRIDERLAIPDDWDFQANGYLLGIPMEDGRWWCLLPLWGGRLRIVIVEDIFSAGEHWCYGDNAAAMQSYLAGPNVAPTGWTRHMLPGGGFERRDEQGNPYVSEAD